MSDNTNSSNSGRIGFFGFLALIFITLKLIGVSVVSTWSWLWVLSPLWIPLTIAFTVLAVLALGWGAVAVANIIATRNKRITRKK